MEKIIAPTILVDPASNVYYSSYYIHGLQDLCSRTLRFSSAPFRTLVYGKDTHIFAFVVDTGKARIKVAIDFADARILQDDFLHWCDVYGKINLQYRPGMEQSHGKIISIPPSFAVRLWSRDRSVTQALKNYARSFKRTVEFRLYLSRYLISSKRSALFAEPDFKTEDGYICSYNTFWEGQDATNEFRANFVRACKNITGVYFEGGLVGSTRDPKYHNLMTTRRITHEEYVSKTRKSVVVFNTPAYHQCHGWKLAEYLALGKAIISTPLANQLPEPLKHGENIYFVDGSNAEIENAITTLITDTKLRKELERGAYEYYTRNVAPVSVIERLIAFAKQVQR